MPLTESHSCFSNVRTRVRLDELLTQEQTGHTSIVQRIRVEIALNVVKASELVQMKLIT